MLLPASDGSGRFTGGAPVPYEAGSTPSVPDLYQSRRQLSRPRRPMAPAEACKRKAMLQGTKGEGEVTAGRLHHGLKRMQRGRGASTR